MTNTPNHDSHQALYRQLAARLKTIQNAWVDASLEAFDKLEVADPELAQLALDVWGTRAGAAAYCARQLDDEHTNGYATLAAGQRKVIIHTLNALRYGHPF